MKTHTHSCTAGLGPDAGILHSDNGAVYHCSAQLTKAGWAPDGEAVRKRNRMP